MFCNPPAAADRCLGWRLIVVLAAVVAIGAVLRLYQINDSLWLDELHTAWTVQDSASVLIQRAEAGHTSSLYFWLPWSTTSIFGMNELAIRLPSIVAGLALIVLVGTAVFHWTNCPLAAVLAATLVAVDRNCVFYSQEARVYVFVQLAGVLSVMLFVRMLDEPTWRNRAVWILSSIVLFYLHFTAALLLVAEAVAFLVLWAASRIGSRYQIPGQYQPWRFAVDSGVVIVCCAAAIPQLSAIASERESWALFIERPSWVDLLTVQLLLPLEAYLAIPLLILVVCRFCCPGDFSAFSPAHEASSRPASRDLRVTLIVAGCWLFVPLLLAWSLSILDILRIYIVRYVIGSVAAAAVLAALCLARCPSRSGRWLIFAGTITWVVYSSGMVQQFRYDRRLLGDRNQGWREAVRYANHDVTETEQPVFVRSGLIEANRLRKSADRANSNFDDQAEPALRDFCLLPVTSMYRLRVENERLMPLPATTDQWLTEADREAVLHQHGAWFIYAGRETGFTRLLKSVLGELSATGAEFVVVRRQAFGSVHVAQIEMAKRADGR